MRKQEKQKIKSSFIRDFKLGDNIIYNLKILGLFYVYFNKENKENKLLLCKPIILLIITIIEAILYDFYCRVKYNTGEGVRKLTSQEIDDIRGKKLLKFEHYIANARKYDLFSEQDSFYDDLSELMGLRNRVHIQNKYKKFEPDDCETFTLERKSKAEGVCEKLLKYMEKYYYRAEKFHCVENFRIPWTLKTS